MKNRWIYIFIIVIAALLYWLRPKQSATVAPPIPEVIQSTNQPVAIVQNAPRISLPANLYTQGIVTSIQNDPQKIEEKLHEFVDRKNKPIEFYGMVIDQDSNPVPDVKVGIGVSWWIVNPITLNIGLQGTNLEHISDANGRFEFHGVTGEGFGVGITKDGYLSPPNARYGFGPQAGTFENPIIFKMWKEGVAAERLIGGSHVFGIDSGKTYTLNLMTGKKIEGQAEGDLIVLITRPTGVKPRDKFAWSFSISTMQGGFAVPDPNDEFMYVAPESGYQPKIEMQFDPSNTNWTGLVRQRLFLTTRNGRIYGRANIEIDSIYNVHSAIQIDYTINPTGSRNLQP